MLLIRSIAVAATLVAGCVSIGGQAATYTVSVIAPQAAQSTFAVGISTSGIVAGNYVSSSVTTAFTYDTKLKKPVVVPFVVPPAHGGTVNNTTIAAMSPAGAIVGNYTEQVGATSTTYGFLYSGGTFTTLDYPGSVETVVTAVASKGAYVAGYYYTPGFPHPFVYNAGRYRALNMTGLGDYSGPQPVTVNNSGFVTGSYYSVDRNENRSFTTTGTVAMDFNPTVPGEHACGINAASALGSTLVGYCYSPVQGMISTGGSVSLYTPPKASGVSFGAINGSGAVAGSAVVGTSYEIFQFLHGSYKTLRLRKTWTDISVVGLNNGGKIVGRFTDSADNAVKVFLAQP